MIHVEGLSHLLDGDTDPADAIFAPPSTERTAEHLPSVAVLLATAAAWRSSGATGQRQRRSPSRRWRSWRGGSSTTTGRAPSCSLGGRLATGDLQQGRSWSPGRWLRPLLTYALPVVSAQALLEMAQAYIALADPGGARAVLRQASDIFQQRPDLGNLPDIAEELGPRSTRSELEHW